MQWVAKSCVDTYALKRRELGFTHCKSHRTKSLNRQLLPELHDHHRTTGLIVQSKGIAAV